MQQKGKKRKKYLPHGVRTMVAKSLNITEFAVDKRMAIGDPDVVNLASRFTRQILEDRRNAGIIKETILGKGSNGQATS